ncbi:MAG: hypothetical protein AAFV07_03480 [Bacteroidota bacterium]
MMLRTVCFVFMMIGLFSMGHTQFWLRHRILVDIRTEGVSLEGAQVLSADADSLTLLVQNDEVYRVGVEDLLTLRMYRPGQWKRGAWIGGLIGLPLFVSVAEEADFWGGLAVWPIPVGIAALVGSRHKLELTVQQESDMRAAYTYLYLWLRRAAKFPFPSIPPPKVSYSNDYTLYPYLHPRRIRLSVSLGRTAGQMHRALGPIIHAVDGVTGYGEYAQNDMGQHMQVQAGYSPTARTSTGMWWIPTISVYQGGNLNYTYPLINDQELYLTGNLDYRISQQMWGLFYAFSPFRDDRRWLWQFMPRLEAGLWGSNIQRMVDIRLDGYGEAINTFEQVASFENQYWKMGAYGGVSLDWYLTKYMILTARYTRLFHLAPILELPKAKVQVARQPIFLGPPAAEVRLQNKAFSIGIGVRI